MAKHLMYASVLLEVDVLDSTTEVNDIKRTTRRRLELQLDGKRDMTLIDIGMVLLVGKAKSKKRRKK